MRMERSGVKDAVLVQPGVLVTSEAQRLEREVSHRVCQSEGPQQCHQG